MADIVMPRLSDTMEEGTILRWLKADGEHVARGEELVEIETDKATMTYESDQEGVLAIIASEGSSLAVGELIATVGDSLPQAASGGSAGSGQDAKPAAVQAPDSQAADASEPAPAAATPAANEPEPGDHDEERVKASPLARRIAEESGVDLHSVSGSGPGGRIVKADVVGAEHAAPAAGEPAALAPAATGALDGVTTAKGETTVVELSRTQQTVARRMAESKATIPEFTVVVDVDMEACVQLREELKRLAGHEGGAGSATSAKIDAPTYNDMVVKAGALALREYPQANGSYRDGKLQLYSRVNVGVAVAAEGALVVPTVFDADEKSLGEISRETRALAGRVRDATITPPELGGGTFTVSNLGMFGVRSFTAIINPPQAAILSVGRLEPRAVAREREIVARQMLTLTLVCDHRILYGAEAARFLARIRELLEAPASLTL